ncbi:NmrA family NAD(P)-binding protein [Zunongwangia sp. H14]|uniref:NmrA family NAD(P)-binding protein n=1 Tax=Zunongwangia sp. H14 TaxID=3240792 RepID=UPI003563DC01
MENNSEKTGDSITIIAIAGATGSLGYKIAVHLKKEGARPRALVRRESSEEKIAMLQKANIEVVKVNYDDHLNLVKAISGVSWKTPGCCHSGQC